LHLEPRGFEGLAAGRVADCSGDPAVADPDRGREAKLERRPGPRAAADERRDRHHDVVVDGNDLLVS
jgi:hypothetical protein